MKFCYFLVCLWGVVSAQAPRFLIKIPTRSRPEQFIQALDQYYAHLSGTIPVQFLITVDYDDPTMNNVEMIEKLKSYPNLVFYFGNNKNKQYAYNADLEKVSWDIVFVTSDDAFPLVKGFDVLLYDAFLAAFPDLDGIINFHDGYVGHDLNTLPVYGKKFYERFGYIVNPVYVGGHADDEYTAISKILGKELYINCVFAKHEHPANTGKAGDALYDLYNTYWEQDVVTFRTRKARNFDVDTGIAPIVYYSEQKQDRFLNTHIFKNKKNGYFVEIAATQDSILSPLHFFEKNYGWSGVRCDPYRNNSAELVNTEIDLFVINAPGMELPFLRSINFDACNIYCLMINNPARLPEVFAYILGKGYRHVAVAGVDDIFVKNHA